MADLALPSDICWSLCWKLCAFVLMSRFKPEPPLLLDSEVDYCEEDLFVWDWEEDGGSRAGAEDC